jgi:hypothetical protein
MDWKGFRMLKTKFSWWKVLAVWAGFLFLHFSYGMFPGFFFRLVAEANETVFLHMKMLFLAYTLVTLAEFVVWRGRIKSASSFLTGRALIAVAYPWLTITFWFLAWALNIHFPLVWELIYSNVMILLGIYLAVRLEELVDGLEFRPALKWMILLVFVFAVFVYVSFSLNPPIHFFTTPPE